MSHFSQGPVSFDGPDRQGLSVIEQNQGGASVRVAMYFPSNDTLDFNCADCNNIDWQGKLILKTSGCGGSY